MATVTAVPTLLVAIGLALTGCSASADAQPTESSTDIALPPTSGTFDYQLGGAYDELPDGAAQATDKAAQPTTEAGGVIPIDVVVRDSESEPLPDAYSICYVNGFQTQPDAADDWADHEDVLLHDDDGDLVVDPDWPDEHILDPSSEHARTIILEHLGAVIDDCGGRGFDAVEIDNLDIAERFDEIAEEGVHALARSYVQRAHNAGLAIAQKNAAEITRTAHNDLGFDFAVTEECAAFDECAAYTEVYGDHVLQIEYPDSLAEAGLEFSEVCDQAAGADRAPLTILRDRDLFAAGDEDHRYESCPN